VVKAQIHAGGRGKGGGVKVAKDAAEALELADDIAAVEGVDMVLICNQPDEAGKVLDALRFTQSDESKRRLARMRPRGDALTWTALMAEPQYQQAQALLREAFAS